MLRLTDSQIHAARMVAANWCNASRQILTASPLLRRDEERALHDHGLAVVSDFLPQYAFEQFAQKLLRPWQGLNKKPRYGNVKNAALGRQKSTLGDLTDMTEVRSIEFGDVENWPRTIPQTPTCGEVWTTGVPGYLIL